MTKSYSFIDIFDNELDIENGNGVKLTEIVIPIIQRDYAQGRNDPETKRIRKRFLQALYDAITDSPITLDFVYGDIDEKGVMTPLDGQQRLTTLFLLHWYVAKKENIQKEEYDFLNKFSYKTRYSARDFCEYLIDFTPTFTKEKLSDEIINQFWFPLDWKKDQTIKSMLVMLDDISEKFSKVDNIWEKLRTNAITFFFLPIKDMGLTDELYIKMNSRGKPLTTFENFKAELEHELKNVDEEICSRIIAKIDKEWTDVLWYYRDSSNTIDEQFLRYFRYICDIICYKNGDSPFGKENDEIDLIKEFFSCTNKNVINNIFVLENFFDCWVNLKKQTNINTFFENYISHEHEIEKIKIKYEIDIFKDCITNYGIKSGQFPLGRLIILYAFIEYLLNQNRITDEQFRRRIRVINNLVNNSADEMSNSTSRVGGNRIPAILEQVDSIITKGLIDDKLDINFNYKQLAEEREKLEWTNINKEKSEELYKLEDNEYLFGQIAIVGLENYELFNRFTKLFECDLDKVDCALMSIGNYAQIDRWRHQLGSSSKTIKSSWITLFHQGALKNFDITKQILNKLLSITDDINDNFLDQVINKYLNECEINNTYDWRYYYINYNEFRPGKYGKYYWRDFLNKPYEFSVMATNTKISENSYQPFLKAIDINNRISKDDFGEKIIDSNYYIISTNNAYIFKDNQTGEEIKRISIEQDDNYIDKEDRIKKFKKQNEQL